MTRPIDLDVAPVPALLAVAHGSPDPRAESVIEALMARVRAERPGLLVSLAHLGFSRPDVSTAVESLATQGISDVVVVPLLLTAAYHVKVDLPVLLAAAQESWPQLRICQAAALGPHPLLLSLLQRRLVEAGADPTASVVLGAIGTSDPIANAELADVAASLGATIGFASAQPDIEGVVAAVRRRAPGAVAVASYVLAPGTLPDRFNATSADIVTRPLGAEPEVVDVVLQRYDAACPAGGETAPAIAAGASRA